VREYDAIGKIVKFNKRNKILREAFKNVVNVPDTDEEEPNAGSNTLKASYLSAGSDFRKTSKLGTKLE